MFYYLIITIYLIAVAFAVVTGIFRWKQLGRPGTTFVWLLICTLASEILSLFLSKTIGNNMPLYHIFAVVQLTFIIAYFLQLHKAYTTGRLVIAITITTIVALLNIIYFQPLTKFNSNFLMLEGIIIITLSIASLYHIIDNEHIEKPSQDVHFWIWFFLLILWSSTFFWWGLYTYIEQNDNLSIIANNIRVLLNVIVYAGTGLALLKLPKHEHNK